MIGPTIEIDGQLKGDEDLVVEGRIKGTVTLRQHTLTIGAQGRLDAQVYAHTILVDGTVNGDLYASECIKIRKTARIEGNILSPRISLEDGARFRGSIDMDAESEAFRKAFGKPAATPSSPSPSPAAAPTGTSAARPADARASESKSGGGADAPKSEGQTA